MLTQEQIKNLKPGDPLLVQGKFSKAHNNGNILVSLSSKVGETSLLELLSFAPAHVSLPSEHGTSVPTTKHNPTRLFREGDEVRLVERYGRKPFTFSVSEVILTVAANEDWKGMVSIAEPDACDTFDIHYSHLELVTPVEELIPYSIDPANTNVILKCGKKFATFEDDDEAQELCDRLNADA